MAPPAPVIELALLEAAVVAAAAEPFTVTAPLVKAETRSANSPLPPLTEVALDAPAPGEAAVFTASAARRAFNAAIWFAHKLWLLINATDMRVPSILLGIRLPCGNRLPANTCRSTHRGASIATRLVRTRHSFAPPGPCRGYRPAIPVNRIADRCEIDANEQRVQSMCVQRGYRRD